MPVPAILAAVSRVAGAAGSAGSAAAGASTISRVAGAAGQVANTAITASYAMQSAGNGLSALVKALLPLGPGLMIVTGATKAIVQGTKEYADMLLNFPVKMLAEIASGFIDVVSGMGKAVAGFVQLASPIHVQKFNLALEDLMAVFGAIFIPIIENSTAFVRMFGDALKSISGPLTNLIIAVFKPFTALMPTLTNSLGAMLAPLGMLVEYISPVIEAFSKLGASIVKVSATAFEALFVGMGVVLEKLSPLLELAAAAAEYFANSLSAFFNVMSKYADMIFGLSSRRKDIKESSVGAAVRPAQIGGIEDYGRKAQQAAFSLGTAVDPAAESARRLKSIDQILSEMLASILLLPEKLGKAILDSLPDPAKKVAESVGGSARDLGRWVEGRGDSARAEIKKRFGIDL